MQINKVAVVGAGTMGSSIAIAVVSRGFPVILKEVNEELLEKGMGRVDKLLQSRIKRGLPEGEASAQRNMIQPAVNYDSFPEADLVIEASSENIDIKRNVFAELDENANINAILASNTSSLPITQLGAFTRRPDKVIGMHFFNPAHRMKLVEIIPGLATSQSTVQSCIEFGQKLGKLAVRVEECPSFLVNRLLGRYMNEALWCLTDGLATAEEIDEAVCQYVMPIGPLALRDMNGADIGLAVAQYNFQEYGERFRPAPILKAMVEASMLGRKTGAGFYRYDPETNKRTSPNPEIERLIKQHNGSAGSKGKEFKVEQLFIPMINEAFLVLQEKICATEDLDPALMAGLGMRKGPLELASDIGFDNLLKKLENAFKETGDERFRPAPLLKRYVWAGKTTVD